MSENGLWEFFNRIPLFHNLNYLAHFAKRPKWLEWVSAEKVPINKNRNSKSLIITIWKIVVKGFNIKKSRSRWSRTCCNILRKEWTLHLALILVKLFETSVNDGHRRGRHSKIDLQKELIATQILYTIYNQSNIKNNSKCLPKISFNQIMFR